MQGRPYIYSNLYSRSSPFEHLKLANGGIVLARNLEDSNHHSTNHQHDSSYRPTHSIQHFFSRYVEFILCFNSLPAQSNMIKRRSQNNMIKLFTSSVKHDWKIISTCDSSIEIPTTVNYILFLNSL